MADLPPSLDNLPRSWSASEHEYVEVLKENTLLTTHWETK